MQIHVVDASFQLETVHFVTIFIFRKEENHPPSPYTVYWQNPAPVPGSGPGSGSGPGPCEGAAARRSWS